MYVVGGIKYIKDDIREKGNKQFSRVLPEQIECKG